MRSDLQLDETDFEILRILMDDHRKSNTEIAAELNISRNTVSNKINQLIEKNIIQNYTILVDPNWFFEKIIFVEIKTNPHEPWLADQLQALPECVNIDGIIGDYSLILKCCIKNDFSSTLSQIDSLMAKSTSKNYQIIDIIHCYKDGGYKFRGTAQKRELDKKDHALLDILKDQGKRSMTSSQISKHLQKRGIVLSQPAVFKRIKGLEDNQIIDRFTISLNYRQLGLKTKFFVRIKVDPAGYDTIALEFLSNQPEIYELYRTGENYGLMAVVRTTDIDSYNLFIQHLYTDARILDTISILALEERKKY